VETTQSVASETMPLAANLSALSFGDFFRQLVTQLRAHQIEPCVLRNYVGLPDSNQGNDLDLMVHAHQLPSAMRALKSIPGIRIVGYNEQFHVAMTFIDGVAAVAGGRAFQIDFIRAFTWKGLPFLSTEEVLASATRRDQNGVSFLVPSPVHEAVVSLLTSLVISGFVKERYFEGARRTLIDTPAEAIASLQPAFGHRVAARVVGLVVQGDQRGLLLCIGPLRRALTTRSFMRRPMSSLMCVLRHHAIVLGVRHSNRTIEMIRIAGIDARLRAQAVVALMPMLRYLAPEIVHRADQEGDGLNAGLSSAALLAWMSEWRTQFGGRKNLTLYVSSTGLLSLSVNPDSCGYSGPLWPASLIMRLLPQAELCILLEPGPLSSSPPSMQAQMHLKCASRSIKLDCSMAVERLAEQMREAIVSALTERTAKRLKSWS
jgi:hypothetical protein